MKASNKLISTAILLAGTAFASSATAQTVDVQHYWTSASEAAAMNALADEYRSRGGNWIDSPASGTDGNIAAAMARISGGDAPSAILMTPTSVLTELAQSGILRDFDDDAEKYGWKDVISDLVWDSLHVDGKLVALPVGIQSTNWIFYSKPIFEELGLSEPTSYEELFEDAQKIQDAGYIGLGVAGDKYSQGEILFNTLLGLGGSDYWNSLFIDRSEDAFKSDTLLKAFEYFRKASTFEDPGSNARTWNETTNLVANGKAGMQFVGDWAKGEFVAAGEVPGEDFGCFLSPGATPTYATLIDVFSFPKTDDPDFQAGQELLAQSLMDPEVQVKISTAKGSVPARSDVDRGSLDACAAKGVEALSAPGAAVTSIWDIVSNDAVGELYDLATRYWTDPSMTPEQGVEAFVNVLKTY